MKCPACGTEMIQKSRRRLLGTGIAFLLASGIAYWFPRVWPVAVVAGLTGAYLIVWATAGKGRWCRECKTFRIAR
ncbi:MAG TPA: hypothetical protein VFJ90_01790 [Candidatus Didemnitutus sp.]|nr:hypothetical protein [Candidatus Didemnitutus sp.]